MFLVNDGYIKTIEFPDHWEAVDKSSDNGVGATEMQILIPDSQGALLSIYSTGRPLHPEVARRLTEVFAEEPHELTEDERLDLVTVLRNHGDAEAFEPKSIRCAAVNGKRALIAEGRWRKSGLQTYGVIVAGPEDDFHRQEIYYMAPEEAFEAHREAAMRVFSSIKWKADGNDLLMIKEEQPAEIG